MVAAPIANGDTPAPKKNAAVPVVPHKLAASTTHPTDPRIVSLSAQLHCWHLNICAGDIMTPQAHTHWLEIRRTIVVSQVAPTALLISTIALLQFGLAQTPLAVRIATAGIVLASGILGAFVQFQSAREAHAIAGADDAPAVLKAHARWLWVVKYITPSIFVVIFVALMVALFT
jgi:hypothetical protein